MIYIYIYPPIFLIYSSNYRNVCGNTWVSSFRFFISMSVYWRVAMQQCFVQPIDSIFHGIIRGCIAGSMDPWRIYPQALTIWNTKDVNLSIKHGDLTLVNWLVVLGCGGFGWKTSVVGLVGFLAIVTPKQINDFPKSCLPIFFKVAIIFVAIFMGK